jgi:hypothetical protein
VKTLETVRVTASLISPIIILASHCIVYEEAAAHPREEDCGIPGVPNRHLRSAPRGPSRTQGNHSTQPEYR